MPISGVTFEEIADAFEAAYDRDELKEMLKKRMSEKLDNITGPNTKWKMVVFDTVTWSEQKGRTTELIRMGYGFNPTHPAMQAIYEKYGMSVEASFQEGGKKTGTVKVTSPGLERNIRTRLQKLDIAAWRLKMTPIESQVCGIEIGGNAAGTGFLVGPDAVLTNYHVLEEVLKGNTEVSKVTCRFDYKILLDKSHLEGVVVELHPTDWNLDSSPNSPAEKTMDPDTPPPTSDQLDYALIRLARPVGQEPIGSQPGKDLQTRGWLTLPAGPLTFTKDMPLMIVQHPGKSPLKLAIDTESVIGETANGLRVRYRTNTDRGSSGSPVFDLNWNLVALHHLGDPACDLPPTYNQGIPIDKVRERLLKSEKAAAALGK